MYQKKGIYQRFGVREYWIVGFRNRTIEQFSLTENGFVLAANIVEKGEVTSKVLPGFKFELQDIF